MKAPILPLSLVLAVLLVGCVAPPRSAYVPPDEEGIETTGVDLHDYQLVVETMVASMLKHGLQTEDGRKPVIALGNLSASKSPHNIDTRMLGELFRVDILKSGLATFSTATDFEHKGGESGDLYKQLKYQNESGYVDPATAKHYGRIVGADYILFGNIYYSERRDFGVTEASYVFTFTLTEVGTGLTGWAGEKTIRKNLRRR
jgi:hypothetical protein